MDTRWTAHIQDVEQRKEFEKLVRNSTTVLGRLYDILEQENAQLLKHEVSEKDFTDTNWPYKQAFRNGRRSEYTRLIDLLSFIRRDK